MTIRHFYEMAKEEGKEDYEICFSNLMLIDKEDELTGIMDVPVHGMATNDETKEARLIVVTEDIKEIQKCLGDACKIVPLDESDGKIEGYQK